MSARALDMVAAAKVSADEDMFALVPVDADWAVVEAHTSPRHTSERMRANDPVKYDILKRALQGGATISGLAHSHKVGIHTLYAIIERDLGGLAQFNQQRAQGWRNVANLCVERAHELVPKAKSLTELGMLGGIAEDKAAMLSGTPGLVVRHEHVSVSAREEMEAVINSMKEEARQAQGRVVEMEGGTEGRSDGGIGGSDASGSGLSIPPSLRPSVPHSGKEDA